MARWVHGRGMGRSVVSRCATALLLAWAGCSSEPPSDRAGEAGGKDGGQGNGQSQEQAGSRAAAGSRSTSSGAGAGGADDDDGAPPPSGQDAGSPPPRTQGDAPEGYCPGATVNERNPGCWDGKSGGFCFQCYGPLEPIGNCTGTMSLPSAPVATCKSDGDCAQFDTFCNPGHPLANAQGCTGASCADGAQCPEGTVCDPSSQEADPTVLRPLPGSGASAPVIGCRVRTCSDPGGVDCGPTFECDPTAPDASWLGCKPRSCSPSAACPTGHACTAGSCTAIPCHEPGASACPAGSRCEAGQGCLGIPCNQPGGVTCPAGMICDATRGACNKLPCNDPGATPCPDPTRCVEVRPGQPNGFECVECMKNEDCGCGSCVKRKCYTRPGFCHPGCV